MFAQSAKPFDELLITLTKNGRRLSEAGFKIEASEPARTVVTDGRGLPYPVQRSTIRVGGMSAVAEWDAALMNTRAAEECEAFLAEIADQVL